MAKAKKTCHQLSDDQLIENYISGVFNSYLINKNNNSSSIAHLVTTLVKSIRQHTAVEKIKAILFNPITNSNYDRYQDALSGLLNQVANDLAVKSTIDFGNVKSLQELSSNVVVSILEPKPEELNLETISLQTLMNVKEPDFVRPFTNNVEIQNQNCRNGK